MRMLSTYPIVFSFAKSPEKRVLLQTAEVLPIAFSFLAVNCDDPRGLRHADGHRTGCPIGSRDSMCDRDWTALLVVPLEFPL